MVEARSHYLWEYDPLQQPKTQKLSDTIEENRAFLIGGGVKTFKSELFCSVYKHFNETEGLASIASFFCVFWLYTRYNEEGHIFLQTSVSLHNLLGF